jgi:hypothetical protein
VAERHRNALLHQHARVLAHEISNLMFLAEIQARQPASAAGEELRRALPLARRLARLLADALAPDPKPRTLSLGEAVEEIETLLVKPSRAHMAPCEIAFTTPTVPALRFRELPCALLLLVQEHLRPQGTEPTRVEVGVAGGAILVRLWPLAADGADAAFVEQEASLSGFRAVRTAQELRLIVPEAGDDI